MKILCRRQERQTSSSTTTNFIVVRSINWFWFGLFSILTLLLLFEPCQCTPNKTIVRMLPQRWTTTTRTTTTRQRRSIIRSSSVKRQHISTPTIRKTTKKKNDDCSNTEMVTPANTRSKFVDQKILFNSRGGGGSSTTAIRTLNVATCINKILSDQNLSAFVAASAFTNGLILIINPNAGFSLYGSSLEKQTLGSFYAELMGAVNIGMSITLSLLSLRKMSIAKAVGYGLLPRLFVGVKNLVTGNLKHIGFQSKLRGIAAKLGMASLIIGSLIFEKGKPQMALKVISVIEILVGTYISLRPASVVRTADIDVSTDDYVKAKALLGSLAQGIVSHGVYVGCLVLDLGRAKSLGVASAVISISQLYSIATHINDDLDLPQRPFWIHSIVMALTAMKLLTSTSNGGIIHEDVVLPLV